MHNSRKSRRNEAIKEILDWVKHIVIAVAAGLLIVFFVVQRNEVVGSSMEPNLHNYDQLLVQKVSRHFSNGINHGDIVTIDADGLDEQVQDKNLIKRVIGIPGDSIDIEDGSVYRNGVKLDEGYIPGLSTAERKWDKYLHVELGEDEYYVLGDNRSKSIDSRIFGPIEKSRIIGEVLIRFYPLDTFGKP